MFICIVIRNMILNNVKKKECLYLILYLRKIGLIKCKGCIGSERIFTRHCLLVHIDHLLQHSPRLRNYENSLMYHDVYFANILLTHHQYQTHLFVR